jgi:hypothetical protein
MLTEMPYPSAEGNLYDEQGNAPKPTTVQAYNRCGVLRQE